jgi:glutaredoxin
MHKKSLWIACLALFCNSFLVAETINDWQDVLSANHNSYPSQSYNLVLYTNNKCPYCHNVSDYLKAQGREIPTKDTQDPAVRAELIQIGGKAQVPCLVINGKALYDSDKIIQWLSAHP